jgi:uncharacterized protein YbaA (DUF1428 family)
MSYVDGFVTPIQKSKVEAYRKIAKTAGRVWRDHGALHYFECVGDDLDVKYCLPFPKGIRIKKGETVIFSFIVFKSRAHRDRVNAKVMKDPRIKCDPATMPFDCTRMLYGGFKTIVEG